MSATEEILKRLDLATDKLSEVAPGAFEAVVAKELTEAVVWCVFSCILLASSVYAATSAISRIRKSEYVANDADVITTVLASVVALVSMVTICDCMVDLLHPEVAAARTILEQIK